MPLPCPCCDQPVSLEPFYSQQSVPVHSCVLVSDQHSAVEFPRGDLALVNCPACGFIWNRDFNPRLMHYSAEYEETQSYSAHFRAFMTESIDRLIDRYGLRNKRVLEIGCGKGEFLTELCQRGNNIGIGFDPSYRPERNEAANGVQVEFIREFYGLEFAHVECDFLCCRMTLEHIHNPREFLQIVRDSLADRDSVIVQFQVPDTMRVLRERAFWDIYYEHCSYFTLGSLERLFRETGFEILDLYRTYDDQYAVIEARPAQAAAAPQVAKETVDEVQAEINAFRLHVSQLQRTWSERLTDERARQRELVVWGSGSKAVAFLNSLSSRNDIRRVVDINPHKHGKYLAGTGHLIVPPESLQSPQPALVLAMNPIYQKEIAADLRRLGVAAEVIAL